MKTGVELIKEERQRQIKEEGWTPEHDDGHDCGQMGNAAAIYALASSYLSSGNDLNETWTQMIDERLMRFWPWEPEWLKISPDAVRNLTKAGALIVAEIDRIQRLQSKSSPTKRCGTCFGTGQVEIQSGPYERPCRECDGTGEVAK
ncbi:hypothetical protein [Prosthecobacter sp.]|uniref:hypothetical protein n=1 Tax=Prosthecobacter sp. TaxID=1965333 RepID=UPI0037838C51